MDETRREFLKRHQDVTPAELDELVRPAKRSRRWVVGLAVALALSVVASVGLGLRLNHVIQNDARVIAADLAREQVAEVQLVLGARAEAGRKLAVRMFEFTVDLARNNEVLRDTDRGWTDLKRRTASLRADVANWREAPVDSSKRIVKAVPELIEALAIFMNRFLAQINQLGPKFATALDGTTEALIADEFDLNALLDAVEVALDPLMGTDQAQRSRWGNLRAEIVGWRAGLEADIVELRGKVDDDTLSREFVSRFVNAFIGR